MKITYMFAAALMMAGIGVSTEASAQRYDGAYNQEVQYDRHARDDRRDDRHDDRRDGRWDRHDDRRDRNWDRHDRGNHYGWRNNDRGRKDCRAVYRHGHRYTVCR